MSTVQEIIDEMADYGFEDTSTTRKVQAINNTVWDICSREPWPFLEKELNLNFNGSSPTPTNVPSDLRAVLKITNVADYTRLSPVRLDDLEDNYASQLTTVGTPLVYYFLAGALKLVPIPSTGNATYRMKYLKWPAALVQADVEATISVPARHHEAVSLGTLIRLYDMEDDTEMAQRFEQKYERKLALMREDLWKQHYDGPDFIHQVEDYDYYYIG